jgi:hypothetical protein
VTRSTDGRLPSAVAAFFTVSAAANAIMVVAFGDLYRRYFTLKYQQAGPAGQFLGDRVDGAMALLLWVTVAVSLLFLGLAALTALRPRPPVLVLDALALLADGGPTVVGRVIEVFSPNRTALPPVFGETQLVLSLLAVGLGMALVARIRPRRRAAPLGQA